MPPSRVKRCVGKLRKQPKTLKKYGIGGIIAICQKATKQTYRSKKGIAKRTKKTKRTKRMKRR